MNTAFPHVLSKARWAVVWAAIGAAMMCALSSFSSEPHPVGYLHTAAVGATGGALGAGILAGGRIGRIGWSMMAGCLVGILLCWDEFAKRKGADLVLMLAAVASDIAVGFTIGAALELFRSRGGDPANPHSTIGTPPS